MATNGSFAQQDQFKSGTEQYPATSGPTESAAGNSSSNDLSKDEVGWYFVEQYYTTLSKSPEKLHLFYGNRSQFVSGLETEVANVSVGRSAIQERIKQLEFQDCKVRISNVDSQASFDNIVIQVIGETSNKSAELKKFVQTFVLAQQPTGYFVLNDIFRYINDEGEEEQVDGGAHEEAAPAPLVEDVEMPKAQTSVDEPAALDTEVVDKKLEEVIEAEPVVVEAPSTNGTPAEPEAESNEAPEAEIEPIPEVAEKEIEEEIQEPEKPADPLPSPVQERKVAPAQPSAPPKPLSWASRAAAALGATPKPAVPAVTPKTATPPAQPRAAPPAQTKPVQAPAAAAIPTTEKEKENAPPGSGWQTAGSETKRQARPQSISGPPEKEGTMGYVRNVTEKVVADDLKAALATHGALVYFDVNRAKNCAFVEFATPEGYQAAAAASPHQVNGEPIYVEARRPKAGAYGGGNYSNNGRGGGVNGRGRGGFEGRPGQNQGGRGNFGGSRGRGGPNTGTPRGARGGAPTTA